METRSVPPSPPSNAESFETFVNVTLDTKWKSRISALARARGAWFSYVYFFPAPTSPRRPQFLFPPGLTDLQSCREPSSQVHRGPAPRRDDGHPRQGRWMQQLNRVMRIARVKILIGSARRRRPALHCLLVDVRPLAVTTVTYCRECPWISHGLPRFKRCGSNFKCIAVHGLFWELDNISYFVSQKHYFIS